MSLTIRIKNQQPIEFEEFEAVDANFRKLNINTDGLPNGEGVWVALSGKDMDDYLANVCDTHYHRVCILLNDAMHFWPLPSAGRYIPYQLNGASRPVLDITLLYEDDKWLWNEDEPF